MNIDVFQEQPFLFTVHVTYSQKYLQRQRQFVEQLWRYVDIFYSVHIQKCGTLTKEFSIIPSPLYHHRGLCNNTIASRYYNLERQNSVSLCRKFWQSPFMRGFQISILTSSDFPPAVYACFMRETGAWNGNSIIITSCY